MSETMRVATLRPGLLVSLKTSVKGGVAYRRTEIDPDHMTETGAREAKWETHRTIEDAAEYELATKVRGKCRSFITAVCAQSDFGLLCPASKEKLLEQAIADARQTAEIFNQQAKLTTISVYIISGRVAYDDVEATKAISSEVSELLETMKQGIAAANPEEIRKAATKAKSIGQMLSDEAGYKVAEAVKQARDIASKIAKMAAESGEVAAVEIQKLKVDAIHAAQAAFLDLDDAKPVESVPAAAPAGLDLEPAAPTQPAPEPEAAPDPRAIAAALRAQVPKMEI